MHSGVVSECALCRRQAPLRPQPKASTGVHTHRTHRLRAAQPNPSCACSQVTAALEHRFGRRALLETTREIVRDLALDPSASNPPVSFDSPGAVMPGSRDLGSRDRGSCGAILRQAESSSDAAATPEMAARRVQAQDRAGEEGVELGNGVWNDMRAV